MNWAALKKGVGHALFPERCLFCAKPVPCGTLFCSSCACEDHQPYVEAGRCAFCGSAYGDCTCGLTTVSVYYYEEGAQPVDPDQTSGSAENTVGSTTAGDATTDISSDATTAASQPSEDAGGVPVALIVGIVVAVAAVAVVVIVLVVRRKKTAN